MKAKGIVDYLFPWFIPLFCFLAGYYLHPLISGNNPESVTVEYSKK